MYYTCFIIYLLLLLLFFLYFSFVRIYQCHHVWFSHDVTTVQPELVVCFCDNWPHCGHCRRNLHLHRRPAVGGSAESTTEKRTISTNQILAS